MQRIELDFIRPAQRSRWAGGVLLAVAIGLAGDMAFSYAGLVRSVKENESIVARAQPGKPPAAPGSAEEMGLARDTAERLDLPWPKLLPALAVAASDQVALLAIEPDAKSGTVKISGDSKDCLAALGYVL